MSFDFNTLTFDEDVANSSPFGDITGSNGSNGSAGVTDLVELLGDYATGIHVFYGMQTEMRNALISDPEKLLRYTKEQLEGKNIRGHYIVDITKVTHCPYDRVYIGYGTSGINLQLILEYKYRVIQKGIAIAVKASVDHVEKFSTYGDDIPIYGETNKEISGFMVIKNRTPGARKLLQLASNEYTRKGLVFPAVIYSFEMKAHDRNVTVVTQPLLPTKPLAFHLLDDPKPETWDYLMAKIGLLCGNPAEGNDRCDYPDKLQQLLAIYTQTDLGEFGLQKGDEFLFDTIGASFGEIPEGSPITTVGIDWDTLVELVHSSYVSIFNLWNHYRNDKAFAKDKYLVEFSKAKMNF